MKKLFTLILICIFLLAGCVTPHYQYFYTPSNSDSYIQGVRYHIWYPEEFKSYFIKQKEGSDRWIKIEKAAHKGQLYLLDLYLLPEDEDDDAGFMVLKYKQNFSYSRALRFFKKDTPEFTLFETDQRMVNGRLTLYFRGVFGEGTNILHISSYLINSETGARIFVFFLTPENQRKYEKLIRDVLNGVVVN